MLFKATFVVQVAAEQFQIKAKNVSIQVYVSIFQRRAETAQW